MLGILVASALSLSCYLGKSFPNCTLTVKMPVGLSLSDISLLATYHESGVSFHFSPRSRCPIDRSVNHLATLLLSACLALLLA